MEVKALLTSARFKAQAETKFKQYDKDGSDALTADELVPAPSERAVEDGSGEGPRGGAEAWMLVHGAEVGLGDLLELLVEL